MAGRHAHLLGAFLEWWGKWSVLDRPINGDRSLFLSERTDQHPHFRLVMATWSLLCMATKDDPRIWEIWPLPTRKYGRDSNLMLWEGWATQDFFMEYVMEIVWQRIEGRHKSKPFGKITRLSHNITYFAHLSRVFQTLVWENFHQQIMNIHTFHSSRIPWPCQNTERNVKMSGKSSENRGQKTIMNRQSVLVPAQSLLDKRHF